MKIHIAKAKAEGLTALAAFDSCLLNMGIGNQNLVYLSSIIPPGSEIVRSKAQFDDSHFGNKLYCVMAQKRVTIRNRQAWAGIGWVQDEQTGKGLFVEHTGHSDDEIQQDITNTLTNMIGKRPETRTSLFGRRILLENPPSGGDEYYLYNYPIYFLIAASNFSF